jgi:hypothetical protein
MDKQNSIIGCGYIPRNVEAICLETNQEAELGEVEYKIIAEPYEREWGYMPFNLGTFLARVTVNVFDVSTGLTYAVEYEPANLVRSTSEHKNDQLEEPVDFSTRAEQIARELKALFEAEEGGISDKHGVLFFAISDDGNDKTSTCSGFIGGRNDRVKHAIFAACSQNPKALEIMKQGTMEAMFQGTMEAMSLRVFSRKEKKE